MSKKVAPLRGMKDLFFDDYQIHEYIQNTSFEIAKLYGYSGISTPILEAIEIFDRTLGESSDVISKEMYSFQDRKGRLLALRPEFTASIIRAYISNNLQQNTPLKLFSSGPVFRYDRPQEGRQRQFHQINAEYIGAKGAFSDAEIIRLATHILNKLEILEEVTLELNSLGCSESRENYEIALKNYFTKYINDLSEDSKKRLDKNPLRILDSKDQKDKEISLNAPVISDYYTRYSAEYFSEVQKFLEQLNVKYTINTRLARGLDYYCHTAFEFTTKKLGAQSTVLAGGRYDKLAGLMGGKDVESVGFAAGIERIALMKDFKQNLKQDRPIILIPIGQEELSYSIKILNLLRNNNIKSSILPEGKIAKRVQSAVSVNANYILFLGSDEVINNNCKIKDLDKKIEKDIKLEHLLKVIKDGF